MSRELESAQMLIYIHTSSSWREEFADHLGHCGPHHARVASRVRHERLRHSPASQVDGADGQVGVDHEHRDLCATGHPVVRVIHRVQLALPRGWRDLSPRVWLIGDGPVSRAVAALRPHAAREGEGGDKRGTGRVWLDAGLDTWLDTWLGTWLDAGLDAGLDTWLDARGCCEARRNGSESNDSRKMVGMGLLATPVPITIMSGLPSPGAIPGCVKSGALLLCVM